MTERSSKVQRLLGLHRPGSPLLLPNPWDPGIARILGSLGYQALATTSSGFAGTLGRLDGAVSRDEALAHAAAIAAATPLPVSADLENGFAHTPEGVAETVRLAAAAGLAGCSIEDYTGEDDSIYDMQLAVERVAAAAEVARAEDTRLVLTARAENHLHGCDDLEDTIARLQAFEQAGSDCVYAPGLSRLADIERVVQSVGVPVNVLVWARGPSLAELASVGVARISVGGAFHVASLAAVEVAAREWLEQGTSGFLKQAVAGAKLRRAFRPGPTSSS